MKSKKAQGLGIEMTGKWIWYILGALVILAGFFLLRTAMKDSFSFFG